MIFVIVGVGVYAFGTNSPNTFGHSLGEIAPPSPCTSPNNFLKFDGTNWVCAAGGSSSQWITSGSNIYYSTGRVGIGTNTPANALDVAGSISASGSLILNGVFIKTYVSSNPQICFSNDGGVPIAIRRATKTCGSGAGACTVPSDWAVCDKNGDCDDGPTCTYYYGEESSATCNSGAINKVVCIGS